MQQDPEPFGYYAPPQATGVRPAVIPLFRAYASTVVVLYIAVIVLWLFLTTDHGGRGPQLSVGADAFATTIVFVAMGIGFGGFYALAALVPYKPWGWTVGLVAICFGLTSCLAVFAIPLLIYWLKPETKAAFCRL